MQIRRKLIVTISFLMLIGPGSSVHATIWNVDAVLQVSNDGGFGASGFHDASSGSPMSGRSFGAITGTGGIGTFNDSTGSLLITVNSPADTGGTTGISGLLNFAGVGPLFGFLDTDSTLDLDFLAPVSGSPFVDMTMTFKGGIGAVCCASGGADAPNSFVSDGAGGATITLWGANGYSNGAYHTDGGATTVGMDLRLKLTQVPEPASMLLMGLGLLGLGFRRR